MSGQSFDLQRACLTAEASPTAKHVLLLLSVRSKNGKCTPGVPSIARDTGLSERTVLRALVELENAKHITRDIKAGVGTTYTVHPCQIDTPNPCHSDTPATVSGHP